MTEIVISPCRSKNLREKNIFPSTFIRKVLIWVSFCGRLWGHGFINDARPPPITSFEYQFRSSGWLNVLSDCRCFLSQLFNPLDLSRIYFAGRIHRHLDPDICARGPVAHQGRVRARRSVRGVHRSVPYPHRGLLPQASTADVTAWNGTIVET